MSIDFAQMAEYLRQGREIEFVYGGREYSITNRAGIWQLCDDTAHVQMEVLCRFEEKELLVKKVAAYSLAGVTIERIFDEGLYDAERLAVL